MATIPDPDFEALLRAIADGDTESVSILAGRNPGLARVAALEGASRQVSTPHFLDGIRHYVYAGDTALHIAAAAYRPDLARTFLDLGANVGARNRHGAEPLHYAADGAPGLPSWDPSAQATTIACLIEAGADPNAPDRRGVTPLHRAVRTRSAAAVQVLLEGGADPNRRNRNGSAPMALTASNTGRSGSGMAEARAQLPAIVALLERHGASA
jgi:ankyrin repeat protein